jgi:hypothetical protein
MKPTLVALALTLAGSALALVACTEEIGLVEPEVASRVDTVSLWALSGSAPHLPSAYHLGTRRVARTDLGAEFDFAFDLTAGNEARLYPTDALGLTGQSGLQITTVPFAQVTTAPGGGYVDSSAVVIAPLTVVVVQSVPTDCVIGLRPYVAKLQILELDLADRRIDFQVLVNANCGYRSLEPGLHND